MKFFISHSSQHKQTIKEIINRLKLNISSWLDEEKLIWGEDLSACFQDAINAETDWVLLFISESAGKSAWVQKEVMWALEKEKSLGRNIILPIAIQGGEEDGFLYFPNLKGRKSLMLNDFTDYGLSHFAQNLSNHLFQLICHELEKFYSPTKKNAVNTVQGADRVLNQFSQKIYEIVFRHRQQNPITIDGVYSKIVDDIEPITREQFDTILDQIITRNLIAGLYYDGHEVFLQEEHLQWKRNFAHEKKAAIARKAASMIKSGMTIYLDAGSTTGEIVKVICKRLEAKNLTNITIVSISIDHANMIIESCAKLGLEAESAIIKLCLLGGKVRLNTGAIIPFSEDEESWEENKFSKIDIAFIGANGITREYCSTNANDEISRKQRFLKKAEQSVLVCDGSKCGIELGHKIVACTDSGYKILINNEPENKELIEVIQAYGDKIILA